MSGGATSTALSKEFLDLIRNIGEAKSKQEEDKIIIEELKTLKGKFTKETTNKKKREYLLRAMYCEMLGHEASWVYIHAVNLTQTHEIMEKRIGYLAVGLFLHENHELIILLINSLQRDLKSSNFLEVCAALGATCRIVNAETIPAVLPHVVDLLAHSQELVRKKAVMVLHKFLRISPSSVSHLQDKFRRALCDRDPAVMNASLAIFYEQALSEAGPYKDLVPSFVSILKQITEHRLSREYDYHRIPAPWMQVKILKILALLGADDQRTSEGMYEILLEVMKRADTGINAGYAVVYECVRTITAIYPNTPLLEAAASSISRFITSENQNLKYLGITALAAIVGVDRKYAAEHQMVVIECMEDPDDTLKRKTLDLLCKITTPGNVRVIVDKLTTYLRATTDAHLRKELVSRVTQLAERYAPDNVWFLNTMNSVFELGGDLVQEDTAHNLMRLIAEGSGDDEQADLDLKVEAVTTYANLLDKATICDLLIQVIAWVLGEYSYVCEEFTEEDILNRLCDALERQHEDPSTRGWIMTALVKISARLGETPPQVLELLDKYTSSKGLDLQQRCYEIQELAKRQETCAAVLPIDGSCEDLEVDPALPFLDGYVQLALRKGARAYIPEADREDFGLGGGGAGGAKEDKYAATGGLRFESYAAPKVGKYAVGAEHDPDTHNNIQIPAAAAEEDRKEGLNTGGVKKKWGRGGFQGDEIAKSAPSPQQAAPAAPVSTGYTVSPNPPPYAAGTAPGAYEPEPLRTAPKSSFDTRPVGAAKNNAAAAAPAPPTEKELLAASLFGDSSASSGGAGRGRAAGGVGGAAKKPAQATASAAQPGKGRGVTTTPAAPSNADLLDLGFGSAAPAAVPAGSRPAAAGGAAAAKKNTGGAAAAPPPAAVDLLSLFDGPVTSSAPVVVGTSSSSLLTPADPFGALMGGPAPASTSGPNYDALRDPSLASSGAGMPLGAAPKVDLPASVARDLEGAPRNPEEAQVLGQDAAVVASYFKAYKLGETAVVVALTSKAPEPLTGFSSSMDIPDMLRVDYTGEPAPRVAAGKTLSYATPLGPGQTAFVVLHVHFNGKFSATMDILQKVSYATSKGPGSIVVKLPLSLADLLRPHKITTQEFGSKWTTTGNERKGRIPGPCTTPAEFSSRLSRFMNVHPVQTINTEVIVAGKLAGTDTYCLFHGKTGSAGVDILIRSPDKSFTDALWQLASRVLA